MDFDKLLEPYVENGRTIALQIKWLTRKGIPETAIDYAMTAVYKRIERGETFINGDALDQTILNVAKDYHNKEIIERFTKHIGDIADTLDSDWNKLGKTKKIWEVLRGRA